MRILTEQDIEGVPLAGKTVAVIGYGNQGAAQALNLRDSGVSVLVGLRPGSRSRARAAEDDLPVVETAEACAAGDVVALMAPDEVLPKLFAAAVVPNLRPGATTLFAHGFSVRFGGIEAPAGIDVVMVAPMGPGQRLRERYLEGSGLPASYAVLEDATGGALKTTLEYAKAIGCARVGLFETTFGEEAEIDLFSEQAVLCGGITRLVTAGFDTLVEAGYGPELAYMECLYELELTVNLIRRYGISGMRERISRTALFGDMTRGDRVVGPGVREAMKEILEEVRDGTFAREQAGDAEGGDAILRRRLEEESRRLIEDVGRRLAPVAHAKDRKTS
jgi:ketol-acid reductoisomerase